MNIFKLYVNSKYTHKITQKIVEEQIKRQRPWFQKINGREGWFAVCPACNNPIRIIGILQGRNPYGRHYIPQPGELEYLINGDANREEMEFCPYYTNRRPIGREAKRPVGNELARTIREVLIEQFDRVIYILSKTSGIQISLTLAKKMLESYKAAQGWRYRGATLDNIPWIFAYMSESQLLWGKKIIDNELATNLKHVAPLIKLDKGIVKSQTGKFLNVEFCFIQHEQKVVEEGLQETIDLVISEKRETIYRKQISFNHDYFNNLICRPDNERRQMHWVELAKEILNDY